MRRRALKLKKADAIAGIPAYTSDQCAPGVIELMDLAEQRRALEIMEEVDRRGISATTGAIPYQSILSHIAPTQQESDKVG